MYIGHDTGLAEMPNEIETGAIKANCHNFPRRGCHFSYLAVTNQSLPAW
jgi:hypothetical protein